MPPLYKFIISAASACALLVFATTSHADSHASALKELADTKVKSWANDPAVISAINAQNAANAGLSQDEIIKLDKQWRAETKAGSGPLIDKVLNNALSGFLKKVKADSQGLYTEIFVMDNKGLNVGQSDVTSDYWQGDEGKWKNTYLKGPGAIEVGGIEQDESTQKFQSQLNVAISDPATGKNIGAVTIGIDMEALGL